MKMKNIILICLFLFLLAPLAQAQGVKVVCADSIFQMKEPDFKTFYYVDVVPKCLNLREIMQLIATENHCCHCEPFVGRISLRILIDEQGNYVRHVVTESTNWRVLKEVEKHVKELRFAPAYQQNKPIKFWLHVPFFLNLI
jgi:hypothetical protein